MSSRVRIDIDKIPTQCIDHKASQIKLSYGKNKCHYCSKLGHVILPCLNFHGKLQTKT